MKANLLILIGICLILTGCTENKIEGKWTVPEWNAIKCIHYGDCKNVPKD